MLFNSVSFLIFFPIVTFLYFALPHRARWFLLLIASCIFYMAFVPIYILALGFTIIVDYCAGLLMSGATGIKRKVYLVASIIVNVGLLAFFKYFNFFNANLAHLAHWFHLSYNPYPLKILLPIGLSFHTFQAMSYTIEVYRGRQAAERHFGIYALYVMFYPQLVAGPIERPQNMLHQFYEPHSFDRQRVTLGLQRMLWGLFQKVVVADNLAVLVDEVYNHPSRYTDLSLIAATVFFAFQIYCDFNGYCDVALGAAQVMGFKLMENFNQPYSSRSIAEFWTRWHISLSTWFRDYVYIPLGGSRVAAWKRYRNVLIVFLISGLWHGANNTYVIWGLLNGLYLVAETMTKTLRQRLGETLGLARHPRPLAWLQIGGTFGLICFAWIFFRANTVHDANYIASHLFVDHWRAILHPTLLKLALTVGLPRSDWIPAFFGLLTLLGVQWLQRRGSLRARLAALPTWQRWLIYYILILAILFNTRAQARQFIYFQF